jgi:Elongation factor Tu GTP binding domain
MASQTDSGGAEDLGVLRFVTCGSVDDGKSTLIGRLLYDTRALHADTLAALDRNARARGLSAPDLSLLTDGLIAEREQGITIDVAYRYFASARRKFIIADCPGHEQYTRNMVTAASSAARRCAQGSPAADPPARHAGGAAGRAPGAAGRQQDGSGRLVGRTLCRDRR